MIDGKYPPIEQLLPHRPPMILIDRLVWTNGVATVCEVTIGPHSMFIQAVGVPAFVGIEYMAQTVAAHGATSPIWRGSPLLWGYYWARTVWKRIASSSNSAKPCALK